MSSSQNKYGLDRYIPSPIKRSIRERCGYGCVCCGLGIYEYEHIDPEFKNAKDHLPSKMALLCGQCHIKVTRGYLSKQVVKECSESPWCIENGYAYEKLELSNKSNIFTVSLGGAIFNNPRCVLEIGNTELLTIESPEEDGAPPQISGAFFDQSGKRIFMIERNQWKGRIDAWDIETTGGAIVRVIVKSCGWHLIRRLVV